MPALLSNLVAEKVSLEQNGDSPYKPPHKGPEGGRSFPEPHANNRLGSTSLNSSTSSVLNGARADGDHHEPSKKRGSLHLRRTASTNDVHDKGLAPDTVNGTKANGNRSNGESHEHPQPNGTPKPSMFDSVASNAQLRQTHQSQARRSFEGTQTGKVWHKGHGRAHSSSAPQDINPAFLSSIQGSPSTTDASTFTNAACASPATQPTQV